MPSLFDPIHLGSLHLPNRIVMAPLTRCRAGEERIPNPLMATYYQQRAGAGLIISEATVINEQGIGYQNTPGIYTEDQVRGWKRVNDTLHTHGGRMFIQLWHMGRISHPSLLPKDLSPVAPSAIAGEGEIRTPVGKLPLPVPRSMGISEIEETILDYRRAAENSLSAGFDGVELHAANGYLPEQFLNDGTNQRTDHYGGGVENRARFILEILDHLFDVWGENRVGIRLSPSGMKFGTRDKDPLGTYSYLVEKLNHYPLAYLHLVEPLQVIPGDSKYLQHISPYFRGIFNGPIISCGGYDPKSAQYALDQGWADMIAFGRAFIANPDLPDRIRLGAALNQADPDTFYTFDHIGFTDYPKLEEHPSRHT